MPGAQKKTRIGNLDAGLACGVLSWIEGGPPFQPVNSGKGQTSLTNDEDVNQTKPSPPRFTYSSFRAETYPPM
jgi:hypothetical protein